MATDFELSRIYAKGWTAGRRSDIDFEAPGFDDELAALNPYTFGAERERWATGFQDALKRSQDQRGRIVR